MKQPEEHLATSRHLGVFKAKDDIEREARVGLDFGYRI